MLEIPDAALEGIGRYHWRGEVRVSLDDLPIYRSGAISSCRYELVLGDGYDTLRRSAVGEVAVFRDDELIGRAARRLMTRSDRQQLASLLEKLGDMLEDSAEDVEAFDLIESTRRRAQLRDARLGELARALLDAGVLDDRVEQALEDRAREHVESNAAMLAAEIDGRLTAARAALPRVAEQVPGHPCGPHKRK